MIAIKKHFTISLIVFLVLVIFLFSCTTTGLPKLKNENSTVLVIKKTQEKPKDIHQDFFVNYRLVFENNKFIIVTSKGDYTIIKNLTPGDYKIVKRQSIYKKSWAGRGHDSKLDIGFTLKPGEITILPYQITFTLKKTQRGVSQNFSVHILSPDRYEDIVEDLEQYENFEYWQINKTTQRQQENLLEAAAAGNVESVQSLLNRGANVDARDWGRGDTALILAAMNDHREIVEMLIRAGADVNAYNQSRWTALMRASGARHVEIVQALLAADADARLFGSAALIWAVLGGDARVVQALVDADIDVNAKDENGYSALMVSAGHDYRRSPDGKTEEWGGHFDIVLVLLKAGVDVNDRDRSGRTALMWAAIFNHPEIVSALLAAGADVNAKDNNGSTALMWAAIKEYPEIIRILLSTGADLDLKDQDGMTALMMAAWNGNTQIVKILLYAEADMNVKDAIGRSALALAREGGHIDIVEILTKAGAKEE